MFDRYQVLWVVVGILHLGELFYDVDECVVVLN